MLHNGIYEQVTNKALDRELAAADKLSRTAPIDAAEQLLALPDRQNSQMRCGQRDDS